MPQRSFNEPGIRLSSSVFSLPQRTRL